VHIHRQCEDARIIIVPSDQFIVGEEAFYDCVQRGMDFVGQNDLILTLGIRPTRPEPGYGYIQIGEPTLTTGIHKVQSFTEKPERDFARIFMESGEFFWNTGMFITNVNYLRQFFLRVVPDISSRLTKVKEIFSIAEELGYVQAHFPSYPNLSMDKAVLELNDSTYHMIGEEQFKAMKDSAYLINMGRGALVDEPVMIEALKNGVIAGAGLDTFEQEPLPADSPLWDLPNVLITPHVTPQLPDREERMLSYVYQNLKAYREGGEFVNRVTPRNIFSK
jgi:hypothetical protein